MPELADLVEGIKSDHENFKKTHTEILKAKADGKTVVDLEAKLATIDTALQAKLDAQDKRLKDAEEKSAKLETALRRGGRDSANSDAEESGRKAALKRAVREWAAKGINKTALSDALEAVIAGKEEMKSLVVQDETNGGFTVHNDLSGRIVQRVFETSPIRKFASVQSINSDTLEGWVDADEFSGSTASEAGSRSTTANGKIGKWTIPVFDVFAEPIASQRMLDDSSLDVEAWITKKVANKLARKQNAAFVSGDGVTAAKGFLTEATISDAAGASGTYDNYIADKKVGYIPTGVNLAVPAIPSTGGTAQGNFIIDATYALKTEYRDSPGTAWGMHRTMFGTIRKLQDAMGNYIWRPGLAGAPSTLNEYPVIEFNDMPAYNSTALTAQPLGMVFANWPEFYQIVDRLGMRVIRDPLTQKGFVLFYSVMRYGGAVINHEAGKFVKFSAA